MAHTKSSGAAKYGRDSQPKYLGVKKHDGERVKIGNIVVRQRGNRIRAGDGMKRGGDDTIYAVREGTVKFATVRKIAFDGSKKRKTVARVLTK